MNDKSILAELKDAYLTFDRRVLAFFRVIFGCTVLGDLLGRASDITLLYSNDGVLTNHFVLFARQAPDQFSLLSAFSSAAEVKFAFWLAGLVCVFYIVGLFTRVAQVLLLIVLTSLNGRNLMFEDGGIVVAILTATWTLFLPVGDRFSVDALRRDAASNVKARVLRRAALKKPVVSLAALAIVLQIAAIYWFNAVHKSGVTWKSGDAIHLVLWQNRLSTAFAVWLGQHEPNWLSPLFGYLTLRIEYLMPVLVLFPVFRVQLRTLAFLLCVSLHGGIALVMTLGIFSYAMMSLVSLQLPPEALLLLGRRLPVRLGRRLVRMRARWVRRFARLGLELQPSPGRGLLRRPLVFLRETVLAILIVAALLEASGNNAAVPKRLQFRQIAVLDPLIMYPRLLQRWSMFAPDAPSDDGVLVIDATTASGAHVDPFTGKPPDFELVRRGPLPYGIWIADYLFKIGLDNYKAYRRDLITYLQTWHRRQGRRAGDRIVSFVAWRTSYDAPARGSKVPGPIRKEEVFRWH